MHISEPHDIVTPSSATDPEKEIQKMLYEQFKEKNWWAKHWTLFFMFPMLPASLPILYLVYFTEESSWTWSLLQAIFGSIFFLFILGLMMSALIKHLYHDIPFIQYKEQFNSENWDENVGDMLKIKY